MSQDQVKDAIVSSSVDSFNAGVEAGIKMEREALLELVQDILTEFRRHESLERFAQVLFQRVGEK